MPIYEKYRESMQGQREVVELPPGRPGRRAGTGCAPSGACRRRRRLPRHRRLFGRHPRALRHDQRLGAAAVAIAASAAVALAIGAVSIRTSGIYFIMITLAFTQMLYYLGISLDALRRRRRHAPQGAQPLRRSSTSATRRRAITWRLPCCSSRVFLIYRLVNSRFGLALRAAQVERGALAGARLLALSLSSRRFRDRRRDVRRRGRCCTRTTPTTSRPA